ncbi:neutral/alkaline non-lysosomal ceramidase N-terminal domain-containing protein [Algoriphagus pacificus]|uniref:Neutral/alkaline non-lysosomal ceramidase N-terminal domain-containing protein n=1 Tax=Algoriphagus pacificus TaxID=2811234 RepID=A0ABS3CB27_9BACT|nr:neutral/alkaline non-lysosomal ceramidase N-terminal domain-containing protein [Algoriphagus pacificus]MBN7814020.1 neutral/alkaline non-lysosomal ceramidase N-terminal domain-containing protein [Algoriphagus pacificus]
MSAKKLFKILGKILLGVFLFIFLVGILTLTTVDRTPIQEQEFYKNTMAELSGIKLKESEASFWLAGWGKANMTPSHPVELVGYAPRGNYEFVQDSSYVKALSLSNGKTTVAWLSYELLIVHPHLAAAVEKAIQEAKLPVDQVIFTATHTHAGMGGYMPGPLGEMAFGGYNEETVELIVKQSLIALGSSIQTQDTVSIQYKKIDASEFVANRFIKDDPIEPSIRQLIFTKNSGEKATFFTYSAHATILSSKFMGLSGDYPFYLMQDLEKEEFDFAMFAAGTVGSHKPLASGNSPEQIQQYAHSLDSIMQVKMTYFSTINRHRIAYGKLPLQLREPHLRISDGIRLRPWLFNYLLGETNVHFDITLIGNTLMIASSGEISGVFFKKWEDLAKAEGLNLIITTFNGGYMGYITPDEYYDRNFHEVREMNWYGPGNGSYYDDLITSLIQKVAN